MQVKFNPEVRNDLADAVRYYESEQVGLGRAFMEEYRAALRRVTDHATVYRRFYRDNRKVILERFDSFAIIYEVWPELIFIKAVADLRRKPLYWADRT